MVEGFYIFLLPDIPTLLWLVFGWQNVLAETITEAVYMSVFESVDRFCQGHSVRAVQDSVMKRYRCVLEIKMKAKFEDGLD